MSDFPVPNVLVDLCSHSFVSVTHALAIETFLALELQTALSETDQQAHVHPGASVA